MGDAVAVWKDGQKLLDKRLVRRDLLGNRARLEKCQSERGKQRVTQSVHAANLREIQAFG